MSLDWAGKLVRRDGKPFKVLHAYRDGKRLILDITNDITYYVLETGRFAGGLGADDWDIIQAPRELVTRFVVCDKDNIIYAVLHTESLAIDRAFSLGDGHRVVRMREWPEGEEA
jgi:hypothetical protein